MTRRRQPPGSTSDSIEIVPSDAAVRDSAPAAPPRHRRNIGDVGAPSRGIAARQGRARSRAEAHEHYVAARDAWTAAMRAAASGRPADLAALAITQETYEAAAAEWERWESGARVAIAVEPDAGSSVGTVVNQELAWRKLHHDEKKSGLIGRIKRRLGG